MSEYSKPYYESNKEKQKETSRLYYKKKSKDPIWRKKENERIRKYFAKKRTENPEWKEKNNKYFRDIMRKRNKIPEEKWKIK